MAHVRSTIGGFDVALDAREATRICKAGVRVVDVVQGTPSLGPPFATEAEAEAFLSGYNAGAFAQDRVVGAIIEQLRMRGDDWVNLDDLTQRLDEVMAQED